MNHTLINTTGTLDELRRECGVAGRVLQDACHLSAYASGWWTKWPKHIEGVAPEDQEQPRPFFPSEVNAMVPTKLMLIVSEVAEGMEAHRKGLRDSHLPHRDGLEVELADTVIRAFDLAGMLGYDLGAAIKEKLEYNAKRADHKPQNRQLEGGKAY